MNKQQAIKLLKSEEWTTADAERALESIDFKDNPDELTVRRLISPFAGSGLDKRQRLQSARKGLVTKKTKELERKEKEHAENVDRYRSDQKQERSFWRGLVGFIYGKAQESGFQDPMVEHVLKDEDNDNENNVA